MKARRIRYQQTGEFHFLTFSCYRRLAYLSRVAAMELFEDALERVRRRYLFAVAGYVVMPEHVHLLVSEPKRVLLSKAIQALKLSVSVRSCERPFWQAHYYDFNISSHAKFVEKLRYIHRNPVKRGLVEKPEDWRWSSFCHYQTGICGTVEIESDWTAQSRGGQLPEWLRHRPGLSTSPVPPPRRTRDRGHLQLSKIPLEIGATRPAVLGARHVVLTQLRLPCLLALFCRHLIRR